MMLRKIRNGIVDFFAAPSNVLMLCAGCGILMTAVMLTVPVFYRDSVGYIAVVRAIGLGNWEMALDLKIIPGLFWLAAPFLYAGFNEMQALTLTSSLFGIAMIFPCYGVLRHYLQDKYAAWGTAAFFFLPEILETSFAPLTDGARWCFFLLSWYLILHFLQNRKWRTLLWLGVSYAGFAVVRSEGIVLVVLLSVWFLWELQRESAPGRRFRNIGKNLLVTALPLVIMLALLSPRMYQCWRETGYPSLDLRQTWAIRGACHFLLPQPESAEIPQSVQNGTKSYGNSRDYADEIFTGRFQRRYWKNAIGGCFIPYLILAVIGAIDRGHRRKWRYQDSLLLCFLLGNAVIYFVMRSAAGRYFYIQALFLLPLAVYGFRLLLRLVKRLHFPAVRPLVFYLPLAIPVVLILCLYQGMSNLRYKNQKHYMTIGRFMQSQPPLRTRSGLPHPVYLVAGDNYGWGFQCHGNEIHYSDNKNVNSLFTIRQILQDGIPAAYCNYACDSLNGTVALKPDYLLLSDYDHASELLTWLGTHWKKLEVPDPSGEIQLYQYQPGNAP